MQLCKIFINVEIQQSLISFSTFRHQYLKDQFPAKLDLLNKGVGGGLIIKDTPLPKMGQRAEHRGNLNVYKRLYSKSYCVNFKFSHV